MRLSMALTPYGRFKDNEELLKTARLADELGFYALSVGDHVAVPKSHEGAVADAWHDPLVLGAAITAVAKRIRVFINVFVVPYHPPLQLAKGIATLDSLSNGRVILGFGVGWLEGEFAALGVAFHERGAITDEYIRAMLTVWQDHHASFHGKYVNFDNIISEPKPAQKPHPPIWIGFGVGNRRALVRAAELGNGIHPMGRSYEQLAKDIEEMKALLAQKGRRVEDFTFSFSFDYGTTFEGYAKHLALTGAKTPIMQGDPKEALKQMDAYARLGVNHITVRFSANGYAEFERCMLDFHQRIMRPLGLGA